MTCPPPDHWASSCARGQRPRLSQLVSDEVVSDDGETPPDTAADHGLGVMHEWPDARMARCTNCQMATCKITLVMTSFRFIAAAVLATSLMALAGCSSEQASVEDPAP